MTTTVCPTCPWRRGATAEAIPNFCVTKARGLRNTVGEGDAFRTIMACHASKPGEERHCGGYVAQVGYTNLAVRVGLMQGRITMPNTDGLDLVDTFEEMLEQVDDEYEPPIDADERWYAMNDGWVE
jgi:uncharacterized protein DUF6283